MFNPADLNAPVNPASPNTRDYLWMGVPLDAPDIRELQPAHGRAWPISPIDTAALGDPMFDGEQFKWWRTDSTVDLTTDRQLFVTYSDYL